MVKFTSIEMIQKIVIIFFIIIFRVLNMESFSSILLAVTAEFMLRRGKKNLRIVAAELLVKEFVYQSTACLPIFITEQ